MQNFYINMLIDAVLQGRHLLLQHYCNEGEEGMPEWNMTGIAVGQGDRPSTPIDLQHSYLICHWPSDCMEPRRTLNFQEAAQLIREHFTDGISEKLYATERGDDPLDQEGGWQGDSELRGVQVSIP